MSEVSIFVDESGGQGGNSKYYVLTMLFHDQADDIAPIIDCHRKGLAERGLLDLPFHAGPLMNGHDQYEGMPLERRKAYFSLFFIDLQHLPITYQTFFYKRNEFADKEALSNRMRRDITTFLFDNLSFFQSFEKVKIYYDNGQQIVASALHAAIEYVLSTNSYLYRKSKNADFILAQAADFLCAIELVARKFDNSEASRTEEKFFGSARNFKRNYLKKVRRKLLRE